MSKSLEDDELREADFAVCQKLIYKHTGIHYPYEKRKLLQNRLRKRMRVLRLASFADYLAHLRGAGARDELQQFLNVITTNETYFFRCQRHWDFFRSWIVERRPLLVGPRRLRIWSAAASTGAEAYTMAIVLQQELGAAALAKVEIVATDVNDAVLREAREGRFRGYAISQTEPEVVARWFRRTGDDHYQIDPRLQRMVQFRVHNLQQPMRGGPFDLVFLRNVMIYFDAKSKEHVLRHVHDVLVPDGYLLVGESESLLSLQHGFDYVRPSLFRRADAS